MSTESAPSPTPRRRWPRTLAALAVGALALGAGAQGALAFGTWDAPLIPGYAEHERITRLAIDCDGAFAKDPASPLNQTKAACAQPRSITQVAGAKSFLGGVGEPDSAWDAVAATKSPQHCDDGDYLYGAGSYPRPESARNTNLLACRAAFDLYMDDAVRWAGEIVPVVDGRPAVLRAQADLGPGNCNDNYDRKYDANRRHKHAQAKCNALISFGRAMHVAQDFFSHANWIDSAWPTTVAPIGLLNPPGLMKTVAAPADVPDFVRYPRTPEQINTFLATTQVVTGGYVGSLTGRVRHSGRKGQARELNKDMGSARIDWKTGAIPRGKGDRGVIGVLGGQDNFQRAAYAAAVTTATAWSDLQQAVKAAYPGARGEMAARALAVDAPWTPCAMAGIATAASREAVGRRARESGACAAPAPPPIVRAAPVDTPMTAPEVRQLRSHAPDLRACPGDAKRVALMVDDVSCAAVLRILRGLDEDLCPGAWEYKPGPKDAHVLCYLPRPGYSGDAGARVFTYLLPHFADGHALG